MLTNHFILFIHKQNSYIYNLYASKPGKNVLVYGLIVLQKMFAISLKSSVETVRVLQRETITCITYQHSCLSMDNGGPFWQHIFCIHYNALIWLVDVSNMCCKILVRIMSGSPLNLELSVKYNYINNHFVLILQVFLNKII